MASAIHPILVSIVYLLRVGACVVREKGICLMPVSACPYGRKRQVSVPIVDTEDTNNMSNRTKVKRWEAVWWVGIIVLCRATMTSPMLVSSYVYR